MATLGKMIRRFAKAVALLVSLIVALLVVFVARPEWFLTSPRVEWVAKRVGAAYRPQWTAFAFEIHSRSFRDKSVSLGLAGFRFDDSAAGTAAAASTATVRFELRLGLRPPVRLTRLDLAQARVESLKLDETKPPPRKAARKKAARYVSLPNLLPGAARSMTFGSIDVRVLRFTVRRSSGTLTGSAWARYPRAGRPQLDAAADVLSRQGAAASRWRARLGLESDLFREGRLTYLDGRGWAEGPAGARVDLRARIFQDGPRTTRLRASLTGRVAARSFSARLTGRQSPESYRVKGGLRVADETGPLRSASLEDCVLDIPLRPRSLTPKSAALRCGLSVEPAPFGAAAGALPKAIVGHAALDVDFKGRTLEGRLDAFQARLDAALGPARSWYEFGASLHAEAAGRLSRLPQSLSGKHLLEARVRVVRFQDLVAFLKGTDYSIPAPLNVLDGPIEASLSTAGDASKPSQRFDFRATTDLAGADERLKAAASGSLLAQNLFTPDRRFFDRTDVDLQQVAFDLPYLRLGPLPKVVVDSRIKSGAAQQAVDPPAVDPPPAPAVKRSTATSIDYSARIFTSAPAVLRSNLAKNPIPVSLDLNATSGAIAGKVAIGGFDAELFRQLTHIDHLTLTLYPGSTEAGLDGLVIYKRPDAVIHIQLLGSTAKPQVALSSDPPMTRDQILALLLYGQPPDALDEDQRANVGNASNGMATGAFGLASLYLFASTPIEYVGYDPATQTYAVKLKLPGGLHMQLGSSSLQESRTLTLRRRLAPHWQIETQAQTSQERGHAITTFLEWFNRY